MQGCLFTRVSNAPCKSAGLCQRSGFAAAVFAVFVNRARYGCQIQSGGAGKLRNCGSYKLFCLEQYVVVFSDICVEPLKSESVLPPRLRNSFHLERPTVADPMRGQGSDQLRSEVTSAPFSRLLCGGRVPCAAGPRPLSGTSELRPPCGLVYGHQLCDPSVHCSDAYANAAVGSGCTSALVVFVAVRFSSPREAG